MMTHHCPSHIEEGSTDGEVDDGHHRGAKRTEGKDSHEAHQDNERAPNIPQLAATQIQGRDPLQANVTHAGEG